MSYQHLLAPLSLGGIDIPNRIVMPPLVIWKAGLDGLVTQDHIGHYEESAGPGLVIVEATAVSPEGRLAATQIGVWSDQQTEGLARLAAVIHSAGAVAGIQIHHAGGRSSAEANGGLPILVPSLTGKSPEGAVVLSGEDISRIIADFGSATRRCIKAGFDVIEIHGAHGYLGSQFLAPLTNLRTDEWGGSLENRVRFLRDCVRTVRVETDRAPRPVVTSVRLGAADGASPPLTIDDGAAAAQILVAAGAQALHVSNAGSQPLLEAPSSWSVTLELARVVKARLGNAVPIIGVGDIKTPEEADNAIAEGIADLIAVGRSMLADPEWAAKTIRGEAERIDRCVDCKPRCFHFTDAEKCPPRRAALRRG